MTRKVTMLDIANAVGVSTTTVSLVLNSKPNNIASETKKKIFEKVDELKYIPNFLAKGLVTKKTYTIGVVIPDIHNPFFSEMLKIIGIIAEVNGYTIIIFNTLNDKEKEEKGVRHLIAKGVDGIILVPLGNKAKVIDILKDNKVPFVISDRYIKTDNDVSAVFCDGEEGIKMGVNYLYNKGRKNIAYLSGETDSEVIELRFNAYIKETKKLGIYNSMLDEVTPITLEGGLLAVENLMKKDIKIDAIMCCSDILAIGALKYLVRNGYDIPVEISVLGFDNIDICEFIEPELSTIAQPITEIAEKSIELLINLMEQKDFKAKQICLSPKIIERDT